jgi:FdhD protein
LTDTVSTARPMHGQAGAAVHAVRINGADSAWGIAVEAPVEITVNGAPWTVLLATPEALDDLAVGLAITEGLVASVRDIAAAQVTTYLEEWRVALTVPALTDERPIGRQRSLISGSACGLCGLESLAALHARRPSSGVIEHAVTDEAIATAMQALAIHQPLNRFTHSVHAAAWCRLDGTIEVSREDVGRHNALDKLVGALARSERLAEPGFILMSSRCSYELVAKASVTGAQLLATLSAPTSLALRWADSLGLPLACALQRGGSAQVVRFPVTLSPAGTV